MLGRHSVADIEVNQDTDQAVEDALAGLATYVISEHTVDGALQLIVDLAADAIRGAEAVGISLNRKGGVVTAVSSQPKVLAIDHLQYQAGTGPCLQAMADGKMQIVNSLLTESRWPEFTNKALYEGVQAVLAFPLRSDEDVFGALNVYSLREAAFSEQAVAVGEVFATRASVLLLNATCYEAATKLAAQLEEALQSRAVIDQAKGVLMEREKVSADQAFEQLKSLSQRSNIKVRELAQRIVDDALRHAG